MRDNCIIYSSIYCPMEEVRERVQDGREILKKLIEHLGEFNDREGVTFLELTEDSLKNLPLIMVKNMGCFDRDNIDVMAFSIKEISFSEKYIETVKGIIAELLQGLSKAGFKSEVLIVRVTKYEEENIGKTVGKKEYAVVYHRIFQ